MSNPISEDCSSGLHDYCTPCECACHDAPPADWQAGWDACMKAMEDAGVDATTIIAEHTRDILKKTFEDWKRRN